MILLTLSIASVIIKTMTACSQYHTVESGNTCFDLSVSYGITLQDILNLNLEVNCNLLQIGQKLCIKGIYTFSQLNTLLAFSL